MKISAVTVEEQYFCFGLMVDTSRCLLRFPWCVVSIFINDCHFCIQNIKWFSQNNIRFKIKYPVCKPASRTRLTSAFTSPSNWKGRHLVSRWVCDTWQRKWGRSGRIRTFFSTRVFTTLHQSGALWYGLVFLHRISRSDGFQALATESTGAWNQSFRSLVVIGQGTWEIIVPYVFENAHSALSIGFLSSYSKWSKWWAKREIQPGHIHHRKALSSMKSIAGHI